MLACQTSACPETVHPNHIINDDLMMTCGSGNHVIDAGPAESTAEWSEITRSA